MTDMRRVIPRQAMTATEWVSPRTGGVWWRIGLDAPFEHITAEKFAAAFRPAEDLDRLVTAIRAMLMEIDVHWEIGWATVKPPAAIAEARRELVEALRQWEAS